MAAVIEQPIRLKTTLKRVSKKKTQAPKPKMNPNKPK